MNNKKIGVFLLSGLIIGPLLGSGIVLLPPIAYKSLGNYALLAWILVMILGMFFAGIFTRLSIEFPGDAGMANAVEKAFGQSFKDLTSNFFLMAACIGPAAVMLLGGDYLSSLFSSYNIRTEIYSIGLIVICFLILLNNIASVGKISLVLTSSIAVVLFTGACFILAGNPVIIKPENSFELSKFGYTILLLFWAIVGWEVIGNYSLEVKNPRKNIKYAAILSCTVVTIIYIVVEPDLQQYR